MKFYYTSSISVMLLGLIYLIGTLALIWLGLSLRKRAKKVWILILPLLLLLYVAPIAEELQIAWTFGHLCKKDAGIFVYKTVEVDGFYDDTHGWRADKLRESGYRWVEGHDRSGGKSTYWRHEWAGNDIRSYQIDHPTARYQYRSDLYGLRVAHGVGRQTSIVIDAQTGEVLGRYIVYSREAPWYFIGLDNPRMGCDGPKGGPHPTHKNTFLIYEDILKPISSSGVDTK